MTSTIGIPIKLLNEAAGHIVTLEITSGEVYRGKLIEAEDNMNVQLKDITVTARDGRVSHLEQVYIRGSHVRYFIVPDMLRNAPMFRSRGGKLSEAQRLLECALRNLRDTGNQWPELTGSAPEPTSNTTAGLTHEWRLETKYYTATLPIWIDELPNVSEWRNEFTKPEAREVVTALGAWVYCFKRPVDQKDLDTIKETMQAISDVIERACGYGGDIACLAVAMPQSTTPYLDKSNEEWEELAMDYGFEYIDSESAGKNEFGEATGVQRVREALEAAEWESSAGLDFGEDEDGFENSFAAEEAEMNMELFGMKDALAGYDGDEERETEEKDVEDLEVMMRKMAAIKEMGEGMGEAERKRFAAKAVNDLLKDL
ncbi:sm-like ribonucleoprotein [Stemphylium lycopersici]|uniref:Sm-like ribonucleoprotein n=1 Tax=Stemphylium lycopersici TaxID=183478 RepID=A0A364N291_STELY|nr:sm-like ribonucleoprotein [Stemphylium lycopersici]RAR01360.1 sm-like ribonucleoprotein [Stemphylium lycopersici]RAR09951.1 sm-like ribonucleoprotein [Stemphylium lycopersici]